MGVTESYARMLKGLLPPGRWLLVSDGVLSETLQANADELARVEGRAVALLTEADPTQMTELLPDFERLFELPGTGTLAQRRARVVALLVRRQRFRPADFKQVLAPILGLAPADVGVIERTHAEAVAMGDAREIWRFFIFRDPGLPGTYDLAAAQKIVDIMKPSHTNGIVIESNTFRCDDPFSLCDRDVLGV